MNIKDLKTKADKKAAVEAREAKLQQLRQISQDFVDADGQVNLAAIKAVYDINPGYSERQNFALNFAGKSIANALASIDTEYELKLDAKNSKHHDNTENIIIKGDNLEVLKILRRNYKGKVKVIYIDPPYNTESEEFVYEDSFAKSLKQLREEYGIDEEAINYLEDIYGLRTHSGWLSFIYPRIKLARELLTDDGVIFISIDDSEQANLKLICDEIFGAGNFVGQLKWEKKKQPSFLANTLINVMEYVTVYAKNSKHLGKLSVSKIEGDTKPLFNGGNEKSVIKFPAGIDVRADEEIIKAGEYKIKTNAIEFLDEVHIKNNKTQNSFRMRAKFRYKQESIDEYCRAGLVFITTGLSMRRFATEEEKQADKAILDMLTDWGENREGFQELYEIFGVADIFTNPKPSRLIKNLIYSNSKDDDIILDFFAGSGTTAQSVMNLNLEDGCRRKFILVQSDEKIDAKKRGSKPAYDFCKDNKLTPVISSICIERVKRASDNIVNNKKEAAQNLDAGYKVFSLVKKPEIIGEDNLQLSGNRAGALNTLYNMMCASGKPLSMKIEPQEKDKLYIIDGDYFVVGECSADLSKVDARIYIDGYAEIDLEQWLNLAGIKNQNPNVMVLY